MSFTIDTSYVDHFSARIQMLSEQRTSRLRSAVAMEPDVTGESFTVERLGSVDATQITTLHGDTPLTSTPHTRRWGYIKDYDVADLIDKASRAKMLIVPDNSYEIKHAGAMGRGIDDEVIAAFGSAVNEGKSGSTSTAFPAGQKVVAGGVGLTIQKLIDAKEILDGNEVDEFHPRFAVVTSTQVSDLLEDDKISNNDYNTVKALVRGEVDTFMGFKFVRSERLLVDGSSDRLCYFYAKPAIRLAIQKEPGTEVNSRPDKRNAKQLYTWGSWGAVRAEDEMIVEVACVE
jgi:hypothetical protein